MKTGAQLYCLCRTPLNLEAKIQVIAALGYECIELAGFSGKDYEGVDAETLGEYIQKAGLEISGAHIPYLRFADSMDNIIQYHKKLGVQKVAIPRPVIESKADIDQLIENIKKYAKALRAEGLDLYYHTHDFEFKEFDGVRPIDRILSDTDIMVEIDVCWATKGELSEDDVMKFLRDYESRVIYLHLKDSDFGKSCPVGMGQLDCKAFYKKAESMGHPYIIVEDDTQLPDGIASICYSMQTIRSYTK